MIGAGVVLLDVHSPVKEVFETKGSGIYTQKTILPNVGSQQKDPNTVGSPQACETVHSD